MIYCMKCDTTERLRVSSVPKHQIFLFLVSFSGTERVDKAETPAPIMDFSPFLHQDWEGKKCHIFNCSVKSNYNN